jgi:serine protease Do
MVLYQKMRQICTLILMVAGLLYANTSAYADYQRAQLWFEQLTPGERFDIQINLILTGDYSGFADGKFGRNTYAALTAFEDQHSIFTNGVLTMIESAMLVRAARGWHDYFNFHEEYDQLAGVKLPIPYGLVGQGERTERGMVWQGRGADFQIETAAFDTFDVSLDELYAIYSDPTSNPGVEYRVRPQNQRFFVVSGRSGSRLFYALFKENGATVSGFIATWGAAMEEDGKRAMLYVASKTKHVSRHGPPLPPVLRPHDSSPDTLGYTQP